MLVTSQCSLSCPFCHNEGQSRDAHQYLNPDHLREHITLLREFSRRITLSGGEPLQAPRIYDLVKLLYDAEFDIALVTSGAGLDRHSDLIRHLTELHVSIISLEESNSLSSCNGAFPKKIQALEQIRQNNASLRICINVPFVDAGHQAAQLGAFLDLSDSIHGDLKFVGELPLPHLMVRSDWSDRWQPLLARMDERRFTVHDSDPRSVVYLDEFGHRVELSEIACAGTDGRYDGGRCFDSMDITIDSQLRLVMCRWQNNAADLRNCVGHSLESTLVSLVGQDTALCPHHILVKAAIRTESTLQPLMFRDHDLWPERLKKTTTRVGNMVSRGELSYEGGGGSTGRLEKEVAAYHGLNYSIATSSGTLALYLAYAALGIREGSEVIVPVYSYPGTVTPLLHLGARVIFCDVDPETGNVCPDSLYRSITANTLAVVVTHMWGSPVNLEAVCAICEDANVALVEDVSHAVGARYHGRKVGSFGQVACFSLQANKPLCAGEGGVLLTNDCHLYERAMILSSLRARIIESIQSTEVKQYWETGLGVKMKIHPIAAAIALEHIRRIDETNATRSSVAQAISDALGDHKHIVAPRVEVGTERVYYTYKPLLKTSAATERDGIVDSLIGLGLKARMPDLRPLHFTRLSQYGNNCVFGERGFPGAENYYSRIISLPTFANATPRLVKYYADTVLEVLDSVFGP